MALLKVLFKPILPSLLVWGLLVWGAAAQTAATGADGTHLLLVPPALTDPAIADADGDHLVMLGTSKPDQTLFVFIGTAFSQTRTSAPGFDLARAIGGAGTYPLLKSALDDGYRVIALDYHYDPAAAPVCNNTLPQDGCFDRFRRAKLFGSGENAAVAVTAAESVPNRLAKLLLYLAQHYPAQGWGQYLAGDQPNWGRIAIAGHSQGAGMAALLAKTYAVERVILFSSPYDHYGKGAPDPNREARWLSQPSATPHDRWYGLYHLREYDSDWLGLSFQILGIPADHIRVETAEPRRPANEVGDVYHHSVIGVRETPLAADGGYLYQRDWDFLLTGK